MAFPHLPRTSQNIITRKKSQNYKRKFVSLTLLLTIYKIRKVKNKTEIPKIRVMLQLSQGLT